MNIQEKISYINSLAIEISEAEIAHVFTQYFGHAQSFGIHVNGVGTEYREGGRVISVYRSDIYLDRSNAGVQLDGIIHVLLRIKRCGVEGVAV